MKIHRDSLSRTLDSVNEALYFNQKASAKDREAAAIWIAKRQGLPSAYADMFAPTDADLRDGIKLFTGERLGPSASLRHVSGEEACRALLLLKPRSKDVKAALESATEGMLKALERAEQTGKDMFCCGTCDPSLWRHITAGGLPGAEHWLGRGMKALKVRRDGEGKWRRFPFFYTLLALSEIDLPAARTEMKYTAPLCEKYLARSQRSSPYTDRRRKLVEQVLAKF
jgi:hypothetical protein